MRPFVCDRRMLIKKLSPDISTLGYCIERDIGICNAEMRMGEKESKTLFLTFYVVSLFLGEQEEEEAL